MFKKLHAEAIIPQYQTKGSVGLDLHSIEAAILAPGKRLLIGTGLSIELPTGYEGQVRPRSGLAIKYGITVLNTPGTIDSDYKGEIKVILYNAGDSVFYIDKGDRIAQLVISPVLIVEDYISDNIRDSGGFGSTGKQ